MGTSAEMSTSNSSVKYSITINLNSQNATNNTSNVTVSVKFWRTNTGYQTYGSGTIWCRIDGTTYSASITSSQKITSTPIILYQNTLNISHNSDGTKNLTCSSWINITSILTSNEQSYSEGLPRLASASSFVMSGSNYIGEVAVFNINRSNQTYTHNLLYDSGSGQVLINSDRVQTTYNWIIPDSFYQLITTSNQGNCMLFCSTYDGNGTYIGYNSQNFTFKIRENTSPPIFDQSSLTYQDTDVPTINITNNNQWIVRNNSSLLVSWSPATAQNSATISNYQIIINSTTITVDPSITSYNLGKLDIGSDQTLSVRANDSRGNYTIISKNVTFFDYQNPSLTCDIFRVDNFESDTNVTVWANISSVNNMNSIKTLQYQYKKTTDTTYSDWIDIQNNTQTTVTIDNNYSFNFNFQVVDAFDGSFILSEIVSKGIPLVFYDTKKNSVGINCFPQNNQTLELNSQTIFSLIYPIGSIFMTTDSTNPSTFFIGTTLVAWGQGQTIVGVNPYDSDFSNSENTEGSKTISLTVDQMPSHNHGIPRGPAGSSYLETIPYGQNSSSSSTYPTNNAGNGTPINIMQPFITCFLWKRTA